MINIKRAYEKAAKEDGWRILVDRLWPRGLSQEKAKVDLWLKDVAPSDSLRKWFHHDPKKWTEFQIKYRQELAENERCINIIRESEKRGPVTLLYAASDQEHNNAVVLKEHIEIEATRV